MNSELDLVNTALGRLGQAPIALFGENINTGLITYQMYATERDALLRTIPWNFARVWASLASLSVAPMALDLIPNSAAPGIVQFTTAFYLPQDCLRVYRFSPKDSHWRIVGKQIYTDAVPATNLGVLLGMQPLGNNGLDNQPPTPSSTPSNTVGIEYIQRIVDVSVFDAQFTEVLIWKIARDTSFGITGLRETFAQAEQMYTQTLADAAAVNGMENWPDEYFNTELTDVRYGYSNLSGFNA